MADLLQLERELAELQAKVLAERARVKGETIDALKAMLASGTLTPDDLLALLPAMPKAAPRDRKKLPKYRDPVSGETWTGQGGTPNWLKGKDRDDFLIVKP